MIQQGTDGVSRGNFLEEVMVGEGVVSFMPLNQTPLERTTGIVDWIKSWVPDGQLRVLDSEDWFDIGHGLVGGERN